jgi:glucose-6-phosphate 1-dehydrogenase
MLRRLLLFGATGDLAGRFLLPALARLHSAGLLPGDLRVVCCTRQDWDDQQFRDHATNELQEHAADVAADSRAALVGSLRYRQVDFADLTSVARAVTAVANSADGDDDATPSKPDTADEPVVAYLALPSAVFGTAIRALCAVGLPPGSRIVLEKPFGTDLESAVELNALLQSVAGVAADRAVFRVDHVLGMATVQNMLAVRLANRVLEPVWNSAHIVRVDILWDETLALEGRASYYDRAGALKDVIQNHLLQILCLIAMEPPVSLTATDLQARKLDVLRSVRPLSAEQVATRTRRARYTAGRLAATGDADGEVVPAYVEEEGVDPRRRTETFAEVVLQLDSWRWAGTEFVLRTGKALRERRKEVIVRFRPVPSLPLGADGSLVEPNELRIGLDGPHDLTLVLTGTAEGPPGRLAPLPLTAPLSAPELPAYSRVLMDVLRGESTLSIGAEEAEQAWRVVTPVLHAWANEQVPLEEYPAGSAGPPPRP